MNNEEYCKYTKHEEMTGFPRYPENNEFCILLFQVWKKHGICSNIWKNLEIWRLNLEFLKFKDFKFIFEKKCSIPFTSCKMVMQSLFLTWKVTILRSTYRLPQEYIRTSVNWEISHCNKAWWDDLIISNWGHLTRPVRTWPAAVLHSITDNFN